MLLKVAYWLLIAGAVLTGWNFILMTVLSGYPTDWVSIGLAVVNILVAHYFIRPQIKNQQ